MVVGSKTSASWRDVIYMAGRQIAEHWACRDDVGLLSQIGAWPPDSTS